MAGPARPLCRRRLPGCAGDRRLAGAAGAETTLAKIDDAVDVTTVCTPPTSLASRDWISQVRVAVKNRSDIRWRCEYSVSPRSSITRWPTQFAYSVCTSPMADVTIGIAIRTKPLRWNLRPGCWIQLLHPRHQVDAVRLEVAPSLTSTGTAEAVPRGSMGAAWSRPTSTPGSRR
jgi:hypothetical protein